VSPARKAASVSLNLSIPVLLMVLRPLAYLVLALRWIRLRYVVLKPRPGDIYIATSPKAGTTWAQMIVYQLITGGRGEFDHISQVSPYCEQVMLKCEHGMGRQVMAQFLEALPSPRILKTHLLYHQLRPPKDSKVIFVTRNAGDSFISLYNHECINVAMRLDFALFFKAFVRGKSAWALHLRSWWPHRNDPNVLHVRYEDLSRNLEGEIRRIAAFCGIPIEESRMGEILEKCSFGYMKQHHYKFDFRLSFFEQNAFHDGFIRKGGVGNARQQLSAEQQAQLEQMVTKLRQELRLSDSEP
jgi:Sulfotransferase domain